ncbi:MAG: CYTH domain-containing protein [Paramuribaculum sp.]|nr:CYTH domain-containing protein [Paramuribaculum sp.]
MAKETELKFLVKNDSWRSRCTEGVRFVQTYLNTAPDATVRLRIAGDSAYLTVKSRNHGAERNEWEYKIPVSDAREMIEDCETSPVIDKTRYRDGRWEIDVYHGALHGLVIAEIELENLHEKVDLPDYIGREITNDTRYYNSSLSQSGEIPLND